MKNTLSSKKNSAVHIAVWDFVCMLPHCSQVSLDFSVILLLRIERMIKIKLLILNVCAWHPEDGIQSRGYFSRRCIPNG